MKRTLLVVLLFGCFVACVQLGWAVEPNAEQAKAVAEIEELDGKVTIDDKNPGKPVIGVAFSNRKVTDAGLEHLKGLTQLQHLILQNTKITDAGLEHLKGLTQLQQLNLNTKVTDQGVERLQQALPKCKIER